MSDDYGYSGAMSQVYMLAALFGVCDLLLTGLVIVSVCYLAPRDARFRWSAAAATFGAALFLIAWHALLGWN